MLRNFAQLSLLLLLLALAFQACVPKKDLVFLQEDENLEQDDDRIYKYQRYEYHLQVNDIIDVQVKSMNEEANKLFAQDGGNNQSMRMGVQGGGDIYYMTGYSVNDSGYVELPIIGGVKVLGLTIPETKKAIETQVQKYYAKYYLKVQLGGIRYSALGEFNAPGKYTVLQNQLTIFEAIANAGDLNTVANRDEVILIRQYPDGTKMHRINLLDRSIIGSPYYFIQPNDIIYVEPLQRKTLGFGVNAAQSVGTLVSVLSSGLALILAIQNVN